MNKYSEDTRVDKTNAIQILYSGQSMTSLEMSVRVRARTYNMQCLRTI